MATHSSVLAWRIKGTGEPGGLPSMRSHSQTRLKQLSSSSSSSSSHALLQGIFLTQGSNSVSYVSSTAGRLAPLGKTVISDFTASQSNPAMCSECLYFLHYSNFQFFKVAGNNLLLGKEHFILFFKQYTIIILTVLEVRSLRWVSMG